ncbi:MAG: cellulase family glycosylhydrolase [Cytophagaceae bacterium]|jgi:hypothetical protein|nr:cellulase family glycosylhydrolase [Cytophagaceae bacterium]
MIKTAGFQILFLVVWCLQASAQFVYIDNKIFKVNGCPIYFNGANTPWDNWNDFGGSYDASFWSSHFALLKSYGINSSRVWISCNGDVQPNINSDGTVTGASSQFWDNLDNFFESARTNGIYIMATMMSFDHTKNTYTRYQSWRNMLNDQNKVQTYVDNYLVPFVNRYKTNPYLMSIDICNEIEWVAENGDNMQCSYATLQRFVAMCAAGIHNNKRTDGSSVLVTMGSAATKWNATFKRSGSFGSGWVTNSDGNKWNDAALKAQYNQANAILDFYSPHYYSWVNEYHHNPFEKTPTNFGMNDKAVLLGETPGGNPGSPNLAPLASYEALKNNGYQGHYPWTSNGVDAYGGIGNFGSAALQFKNNYPTLIYPSCPLNVNSTEENQSNGMDPDAYSIYYSDNICYFKAGNKSIHLTLYSTAGNTFEIGTVPAESSLAVGSDKTSGVYVLEIAVEGAQTTRKERIWIQP